MPLGICTAYNLNMARGKQTHLQKLMADRKRPSPPSVAESAVAVKLFKFDLKDQELNQAAKEYAAWFGTHHKSFGPLIKLDTDNPDEADWLIDVNKNYQPTEIHFKPAALEQAPRRLAYGMALGIGYSLFPAFTQIDEVQATQLLEQTFTAAGTSSTVVGLFTRLAAIEQELEEHQDKPAALRSRQIEQENITQRLEAQNIMLSAYLNWVIWEPQSPFRGAILQHLFDRNNAGARDGIIGQFKRNGDGDVINMSKEITDGFNRFNANPIIIWPQNEWQAIRPEFLKTIKQWLY